MKKTIYITLAIFAFTFAAAGTSLACSCTESIDPIEKQVTDSYENSAAIFSGKVTSVKPTADRYDVIVTLTVKESWKGINGKRIKVRTAKDSSMCGYHFELGKEYLVYAHGTARDLGVGNCSRTTSLADMTDIEYLANLKKKHAAKK